MMNSESCELFPRLAIVGGGPAGLRAAEVAAAVGGLHVTVFDSKPSVGRKFLVAGKGGLNLTHGEAVEKFVTRYSGPEMAAGIWEGLMRDFGPGDLREWAAELGVETFQATSGRVYPKALKAAPMLRRWIARLRELDVEFAMNRRCVALTERPGGYRLDFQSGEIAEVDAVVFAMGGGSWAKTGSDGGWTTMFEKLGIAVNPLEPANCGWEHPWSAEVLAEAEGKPLKNIRASAGGVAAIGELMITRYGLEGGAIYQLGATLRAMAEPAIVIDFKSTFSHEQLVAKMASARRDFLKEAKVRWRLSEAAAAVLGEKNWVDIESLAREVKACVIPLTGPRPLDEAISSAGGVHWNEIDETLMVKKFPGIFVAGEMIDWEAPTGGYLMQGCFATGARAGLSAARFLGV